MGNEEVVVIPQAVESEKAIIGTLMTDGRSAMKMIQHILTRDDFFDRKLSVIWRASEYLMKRDKDIDLITLSDFLSIKGYIDSVGGAAGLASMSNCYVGLNMLVNHAKIVSDRATARRIIKAASDIVVKARVADDMDTFINDAERSLKGVTKSSARSQSKLSIVDLDEWREIARNTAPPSGQIRGLSLGYQCIDDMTEGFEPGEVIVLTGHTKHGKSKLAANFAWNVAKEGKNVLFINTEMTKLQVARRMNAMTKEDKTLSGKIYINDRADLDSRDATALMESAKEMGVDMVIIDHLHFFSRSTDNQTNEISKITKEFKEAAVQLELPLLLLCHIQQGDTSRRPTLQMLKGSSSIAQDADVVMTVWRDDRPNAPDPFKTEVIRLAHRSAERAVTRVVLYGDGMRLLEHRPPTTDQQKKWAEDAERMIGGKKDDEDLEAGW